MKRNLNENSEHLNRLKQYEDLSRQEGLLPVKVSRFYKQKVAEEVEALGGTDGPLYRAVYPSEEKLNLRAPGEVKDFVDDRINTNQNSDQSIVQKYRNRALFFPTSQCISHCQYCFRQDILAEQKVNQASIRKDLKYLKQFISDHPEVTEMILSGGDPLFLSAEVLSHILDTISSQKTIQHIRIHSRALVFSPEIITPEKIKHLSEHNVRLVSHTIHPYEICDQVKAKISEIESAGVRLYNQFPMLRGTNDHPDVIISLLELLDGLKIRNISVFIPDPINYSASFRIGLNRLFAIFDQVNWSTASWLNSTRLVLDSVHGKVRREDMKDYNYETGIVTFEREGKTVTYRDLPAELDKPGDIKKMLWKTNQTI